MIRPGTMLIAAMLVIGSPPEAVGAQQRADTTFGQLIAKLSEPGGVFFSDNLVSNETSYLHIVGKLRSLGLHGGVYLGVGPEQNFSYIAQVKPKYAFIIDIRRDNLLLQLLFKAMFETAANRLEFLCLLYGRPLPPKGGSSAGRPLEELLAYIDVNPIDSTGAAERQRQLFERVASYGARVTPAEFETLRRLHNEFVTEGLSLRFSSAGRRSWAVFPSSRDLYQERDLTGRQASYLVSEDRFQTVQSMEKNNRIIPVVGDLGGPFALQAIGRYVAELHERVRLFYTSNVEFYLFRQGTFAQFARNMASLPRDKSSLIARSYFDRQTGQPHPLAVPGHFSVQLLQSIDRFVEAARDSVLPTYWELVNEDPIPLGSKR